MQHGVAWHNMLAYLCLPSDVTSLGWWHK